MSCSLGRRGRFAWGTVNVSDSVAFVVAKRVLTDQLRKIVVDGLKYQKHLVVLVEEAENLKILLQREALTRWVAVVKRKTSCLKKKVLKGP